MKTKNLMILLAGCGALALSAGCNQNEAAAPAAAKEAPPTAAPSAVPSQSAEAAEAAKAEAMKQQAAADQLATEKAAAAKTAAEKLAQTTTATAQEQDRIQSLIDTAKNLTGQNKYAEALKILGDLADAKLTPEQQALVDGLKQTAEKQAAQAMANKATSSASTAAGDLLGGKE